MSFPIAPMGKDAVVACIPFAPCLAATFAHRALPDRPCIRLKEIAAVRFVIITAFAASLTFFGAAVPAQQVNQKFTDTLLKAGDAADRAREAYPPEV